MLDLIVEISQPIGHCPDLRSSMIFNPFQSVHVFVTDFSRSNEFLLWVGDAPLEVDRLSGCSATDFCGQLHAEGVHVRLKCSQNGLELQISRTNAGSIPLYFAKQGEKVFLSWKYEFVAERLKAREPNIDFCRIYLEHGDCQVRDTFLKGISHLWPGERVSVNSSSVQFFEASDVGVAVERTITTDANVCGAFLEYLEHAVSRFSDRSDKGLLELSGGLDSSCVAVAASATGLDFASYGLIHPGIMGSQQTARRRELITIIRSKDYEYPSCRHLPLSSLSENECTTTLLDDNHRLSCGMAIDSHPHARFDFAVSGVGGDELTMEHTYQRLEFEVPGFASRSAVVTGAARADLFLRRGIWPVNPLLDHDVINFCRSLPQRFRDGRLLNRLVLVRSGLSDGFILPARSEHYGHGMQAEAALYDYDQALENSQLYDHGICDPGPLIRAAQQASYGGFSYELIFKLYTALRLSALIKRYCC